MIPSLNPATIGGAPGSLREYVVLAERYGFGGIEIGLDQAIKAADETSWDTVLALFEQYEVAPATAGLPVDWRGPEEKFEASLAELPRLAAAAERIRCMSLCTWLPPAIDTDPQQFRKQCVLRFRKVAEVLGDRGLRLGLEFVGPQTLRSGPSAMGEREFIYTLSQTLDLIRDIDAHAANVGLLVDSFHWFCTGSRVEEIAALTPKQVVHVHINDAPDRPAKDQMDFERLLPGEGVIDLKAFLSALAGIGYRGFVAAEVFNKDLVALGREAASEKAGAAMERLMMGR